MLKNYLKIALRNLINNKVFTLTNIVGLTSALAVSLLLVMTALFELSYDQFHAKKDSVYQVYLSSQTPRGLESGTSQPVPLAPALKADVPGIKHAVRTLSDDVLAIYKEKEINLDAEFSDPAFFNIFTFPAVKGNAENPLSDKNNVAISEEGAQKLFGSTDNVIGKSISLQLGKQEQLFTISTILEDPPPNNSMDFDIVIPFENHPEYISNMDRWDSQFHLVYVELEEGITPEQFEKNTRDFTSLHYKGSIENAIRDGAVANADGLYKQFHLLSIADMHFTSFASGMAEVKRTFPYMILGIAFVIIFIVCANFINMNIALSERRLKEIGMRKTLGAVKKQLFFQFWMESLLVFMVSTILGLVLGNLLLEPFKTLFNTRATLDYVTQPKILLIFGLSIFCVTLIAGGYPALLMSRLGTLRALKGKLDFGKNRLRNSLIVLQFTIAILLISGTLVLHGQIEFMRNKDLGYNKEQVISIPLNGKKDSYRVVELLRDELKGNIDILNISGADNNLGLGRDGSSMNSMMGFDYQGRGVVTNALTVDYDYAKTLDLEVVAGRTFSRDFAADSLSLVINETMAKQLGEEDPLSIRIPMDDGATTYSVIGVVKDFNFQDISKQVNPLTLFMNNDWDLYYAYVKIAPENIAGSFEAVEKAWSKIEPQAEFLGSFLDENLDRTFRREKTMATIVTSGSILGILLSCIGLFAISMLVVGQRTKEIGVRKVLGASISSVAILLTKDFLKLVALAFIISTPIAWYFLNEWLQNYASHVVLSPLFFVAAGLTACLIAFATVGSRTLKAASANPVKSLRDE
ncbi:MAG: ABC transporter permease [Bacteroidota bacterium]|uniref:ABC transporter permease n=1 Tax=Flagellimonas profundi TaxID=2915620 RepID=A0ABS3FGB5_9FLAO|nr:ABC transporter permease [Allomuricauda profundi]MBO0342016.1 ABC transporter permease [Allomuricauda profundi]MEC7769922.1 ABC transporter permease [Bacteroidota bacterium]